MLRSNQEALLDLTWNLTWKPKNGSLKNHNLVARNDVYRIGAVMNTRREVIELLARSSYDTWRLQKSRGNGVPIETLLTEPTDHDYERAAAAYDALLDAGVIGARW